MTDDEFWEAVIAALLALVGAIEKWRGKKPTTKELREKGKACVKNETAKDKKS